MPQDGHVAEFMRDLEEAANHILEIVTSQRSSWDLVSNILVLHNWTFLGIQALRTQKILYAFCQKTQMWSGVSLVAYLMIIFPL